MARKYKHDIFISHATEDKPDVVTPLMLELLRRGVRDIWLDEVQLRIGDSLRRGIERGLNESKYVLVVLSPIFFKKYWTGLELDAAFSLQRKLIPVWHGVTSAQIRRKSPFLADRIALDVAIGIDKVADEIVRMLEDDGTTLFSAKAATREETEMFWFMVELYIQHRLGRLEESQRKQMDEFSEMAGIAWTEHCESELDISPDLVPNMRDVFGILDDDEATALILSLLKERSGVLFPREDGLDDIVAKLNAPIKKGAKKAAKKKAAKKKAVRKKAVRKKAVRSKTAKKKSAVAKTGKARSRTR